MALVNDDIIVTSIERDENRYQEAVKNVHNFELHNRINLILDDAFNVNLGDKYDLIFIDAAKSQYIKFFEKFKHNLKDNGVIVSDNLNFHGLTNSNDPIASRSLRGIVRKLNAYIEFLNNNEEFDTTFYDIGDGIGISIKKI
jgi:predicted O-methyltransferase YrrM